jgi:hypothetical protein
MSLNRISMCVAFGILLLLLATPGFAQGLAGMQIFAPADNSTFGGMPELNEGYFFQYDVLYWNFSKPDTTTIGKEGATRTVWMGTSSLLSRTESNTLTTAGLTSQDRLGSRFEFGRIEDRNGWMCTIFQPRNLDQYLKYNSAEVVFYDPVFGNNQHYLEGPVGSDTSGTAVIKELPVMFYNLQLKQRSKSWGVELMYMHRTYTYHNGSTLEFYGGAHYFDFEDFFGVTTGTNAPSGSTIPSFLGGSSWGNEAKNHVIGPEFGVRWSKKQGRWTLNAEGRFTAGFNNQDITETVDFGPKLNPGSSTNHATTWQPLTLGHTYSTYEEYACEWSPMVELRLEARYQITKSFSAQVGWSGFWIDGIARGADMIDYTVNGNTEKIMGINMANNRQSLIANGVTFGVEFNR